MWVGYETVGALAAVEYVSHLGDDRGRASVCGVNVQPEPFALAHVGDGGHGVYARRRGRADGRDDAEGEYARGSVLFDCALERGGVHSELRVGRNLSQRALA